MGFGMKPSTRSLMVWQLLLVCFAILPLCHDQVLAKNGEAFAEAFGEESQDETEATISSDTSKRLQESVRRLNAWITFKNNDQQLRSRLLLNVLDTQAAKGENADLEELKSIHERFTSITDVDLSLNTELGEVTDALVRQITNLNGNRMLDIASGLAAARGQYRQISAAELMRQRDVMQRDLRGLIRFARESMESKERAELFEKLGLPGAIEELDKIKFDLPPANSAADINFSVDW